MDGCHLNNIDGIVYYTSKISQNILNLPSNNRIQYIKYPYLPSNENIQNNIPIDNKLTKITLYDYQIEALKKLKEHYEKNSRGILSLMCGMGKTLISYEFSKKYDRIIIISPIRQFVKQNLNRFKEYGCEKNYLTISNYEFLNKWNNLINKFKNLFQSNESIWYDKYNIMILFIETNNTKPLRSSENQVEKSIANWLNANKQKYFKKMDIMKNKSIRNKWNELIKKYPILN